MLKTVMGINDIVENMLPFFRIVWRIESLKEMNLFQNGNIL